MDRMLRSAARLAAGCLCLAGAAAAQEARGLLTGREPKGLEVYESAMTPAQRKWQYPQSLYYFYRWTGEE